MMQPSPIRSVPPLVLFVALVSAAPAQSQNADARTPSREQAAAKAASQPYTSDTPDILRETQLGINQTGYTGLIWWIPFEFWQKSSAERGLTAEQTEMALGKLRDYTVVCIFAAKVGSLGSFDFVSAEAIEKNTFLRDADGKEYSVIKDPSQDAKNLAAMIRPVLSAALGKAGENTQMLFFPSRSKEGSMIADATHKGQFSIVVRAFLGEPEAVYLWRLPLTSVSPPKYCPVGKERVNLNWEYCPWHGVPLNASSTH